MSPRLIQFGAALETNKRMKKANQNEYTKNVLTARRTRAMRDEAKYNS